MQYTHKVKPKVVIVCQYYPPHIGGLEVVAQKQAETLVQLGYEVSVVTIQTKDGGYSVSQENGVTVYRTPASNYFDKNFGIPFALYGTKFVSILWQEISSADIVHLHDVFYMTSWLTWLYCRLQKKTLILTQHVALVKHQSNLVTVIQKGVYGSLGRIIFKDAKRIISYNRNVTQFIKSFNIDELKVIETRNGIDLTFFHPVTPDYKRELRKEFGLPLDTPVVLFVGRLVAKKGFDLLFNAHASVYGTDSSYNLVFAGSGNYSKDWDKSRGVYFMGARDRATLSKLYQAADVFVFPSVGEVFTLAMQEAMASGLPIITTDDPGYDVYSLNKDLMIFTQPEVKALAVSIEKVLTDSNLRARMREYSMDIAQKWFNWETNFSVLEGIYKSYIKPRETSARTKLLVFTPYFYPKIGGVEKHTYNLYRGLHKTGRYEVTVVTSRYDPSIREQESLEGMKILRLPYQFKLSNTPISFKWKNMVRNIIKTENPDVILAHAPVPFLADIAIFSSGRIPSILKYHSGSMRKEKPTLYNLLINVYEKFALTRLAKKANYLICTSDFVRESFLGNYLSKSVTITPAIDINTFNPAAVTNYTSKTVLYVGRLDKTSRWKGLNYLIDAFTLVNKVYPDSRLRIVGEGDDLKNLQNYAETVELKGKVIFFGALGGDDLTRIYREAGVVVLPSTTDAESFGMVLIEAMACKIPVIASKVGGTPYVIEDGISGLLVPPKNPVALADAIVKIFFNPKLAETMAENGFKNVQEKYTWEAQVRRTEGIITKVLTQDTKLNGNFYATN